MLRMLTIVALLGVSTARAGPTAPAATTVTVEVNIGWTWVPARWVHGVYRRGHWHHPAHGVHRSSYRHGPPAHVRPPPRANAEWVPGHWEGRGHRRHWVPGHWVHRPRK